MTKQILWLVPLALAGCKKTTVEAQNASVAEVANRMQESGLSQTTLRPGQWATTVTVSNIAAPGVPPQIEQQMRASIGKQRTVTECLNEERAKQPFTNFANGPGEDCRYDHFKMGNGQIDARLTCQHRGMARTMQLAGTYTPERYQAQMDSRAVGDGPMKRLSMTMTLDAKRLGDCPKVQG